MTTREVVNERSEYILRVHNIPPEARDTVEYMLRKYAATFRHAGVTRIDRDERGEWATRLRRKRIV